ncbi:MAG: PCRF domain-containing protein [Pseudomonadales bacterium]|nr:PCRF domain-containing protein [Pseudomonadales bacterium]
MTNPYQEQIDELEKKIEESTFLLSDDEMKDLAQADIDNLKIQKEQLENASQIYVQGQNAPEEVTTEKVNCIIEIRSGAGGDEAKIWANDLLRMYIRFCEILNLKIEYIDDSVIKVLGKTRSLNEIHPKDKDYLTAYQIFKYELGVHRVQRVPTTEAQGRIHTSTASVAVLPEIHSKEIEIKTEDLEWQFIRASGAGGQSVNKTSSAARLFHKPSGIMIVSKQEKKQEQNRKIALELLRSQLWEIEEEAKNIKIGAARSAIGRAQRAEKIRTYNYPQNRITDHRSKQSWHNLPLALDGDLSKMMIELHPVMNEIYAVDQSEKEINQNNQEVNKNDNNAE